jgi:acyl-CoA thioesterase FadM
MDDALNVITRVDKVQGAVIEFDQQILRGSAKIVEARVRVVTLRNERPVRPPRALIAALGSSNVP